MFAVLEIEEYKRGIIKRLKRLFESDDVLMNYRTVKGCVPFITIKIKKKPSGINWDEVRNAAGVCAQRLLLSKSVEIPKGYGLVRFEPDAYKNIPLFNSMMQVLKSVEKKNNLNVTVLDKEGVLCERIDSLLDHVRHITVLTDSISDYRTASQRVMDSCGAAIVINDYDYPEVTDSIVFADKYDERSKRCKVVFCPDSKNENTIGGDCIEAEYYVLEQKPECVDTLDFVAALYEFNGFRRANEYAFRRFVFQGQEITPEDLKKMIGEAL